MNKKPIIGIIGFGMVGQAIHHGFSLTTDFRIYDKDPKLSDNTFREVIEDSDFIFICVPTPMKKKTGGADISIIKEVLDSILKTNYRKDIRLDEKIIIIKSTVPPGTTAKLSWKYPELNIIHNPEFLTARSFRLDFINQSRIILGGNEEDCKKVEELYRMRFLHTPIYITDSTTAEMAKYTANCFFATKISFFNEIYDICQKLDIDYYDVVKMTLADGRIGNSHYDVPGHDGLRGYGGLCFPKDINALIHKAEELGLDPIILKAAWEKNLKVRPKKDWESIKGAIS
jgi:nucleotide sugar dehydrogenase